jgi:hypothetical protein
MGNLPEYHGAAAILGHLRRHEFDLDSIKKPSVIAELNSVFS